MYADWARERSAERTGRDGVPICELQSEPSDVVNLLIYHKGVLRNQTGMRTQHIYSSIDQLRKALSSVCGRLPVSRCKARKIRSEQCPPGLRIPHSRRKRSSTHRRNQCHIAMLTEGSAAKPQTNTALLPLCRFHHHRFRVAANPLPPLIQPRPVMLQTTPCCQPPKCALAGLDRRPSLPPQSEGLRALMPSTKEPHRCGSQSPSRW